MSLHSENVSLETVRRGEVESQDGASSRPIRSADKGLSAWLFILASFVAEAVLWGMSVARRSLQ